MCVVRIRLKWVNEDGEQREAWWDKKKERKKEMMIDREPSVDLHAYLCCFELFPSQLVSCVADWGSAVTDSWCSCFRLTDGHGDRLWCSLKTDSPCLCVLPQPFCSAVSHRQHGWRYQLYPRLTVEVCCWVVGVRDKGGGRRRWRQGVNWWK